MRKKRLLAITGVLFGSPICADTCRHYLSFTGDAAQLLFGLFFLAPLYGGAALLIREAAVRSGRGWIGILLMAAAFGILMPGLIDLSMLGEQQKDIPYWNELRIPTLIPALGLSAYPLSIWILGHVTMSIGAPLALLDSLAPSLRGKPLLGWWEILLLAVLFAVFAWLIHQDGRTTYGYVPGTPQVATVAAFTAAFVLVAFSPIGRPLRQRPRSWTPGWRVSFAGGFIGTPGFRSDSAHVGWLCGGLDIDCFDLGQHPVVRPVRGVGPGPDYWPGLRGDHGSHTRGLSGPRPEWVEPIAKYLQNTVFLALVLGICVLARNTARSKDGRIANAP